MSNTYLHHSNLYLCQNKEDSFQRDLIYVALLFTNLIYTSGTQNGMSSSISKGREEKPSKHSTNKAQNKVRIVSKPLSMHRSKWPNDDVPIQNEAGREVRGQTKKYHKITQLLQKMDGVTNAAERQPVTCVSAKNSCRHPQLSEPWGPRPHALEIRTRK